MKQRNSSMNKNTLLRDQFATRAFEIKLKNTGKREQIELDDNLIKIIENEYATKYLESLNIDPTMGNIRQLLAMKPLSDCQINSGGWSGSGIMAENIQVIPNKRRHQQAAMINKMPGLKNRRKAIQEKVMDSQIEKFENRYLAMKKNLEHTKSMHLPYVEYIHGTYDKQNSSALAPQEMPLKKKQT